MNIIYRDGQVFREHEILASEAAFSDESEGRRFSATPDILRNDYQRDRDRILHSKAFRRLSHKTQVFIAAEGDHFRTRLTHTLEVAQIARTIARALALNEDLTEAIALGHDLGHTPFGHTGEEALSQSIAQYRGIESFGSAGPSAQERAGLLFKHNEQSLRVVEVIEHNGSGLNLTYEVRDGIAHHSGAVRPDTLEGRIVSIADRIAYVNHDTDDAIRAGILKEEDLPQSTHELIGLTHSARIETLVLSTVRTSASVGDICMDQKTWDAMMELRLYLFENVYRSPQVQSEMNKAKLLITQLFDYYMNHLDMVPDEFHAISEGDSLRAVTDYIASMTDRYARNRFRDLFEPRSMQY
ncbi:MAG: deoxyguanosinetriphosphate triphosphohydrolase [Eggerthellaceae bacterium]|jgi:dGTPase